MSTTAEIGSHYDAGRVTVIEPKRGWRALDVRELWDYRELLYFLVWRDVKIRYKQTAVGVVWVILQPLLTAAIFTVIFGHYAHLQSEVPYLLLTLAAFVPWLLFANALSSSTKSIVENQALVTKVYVPRVLIPIAPVLAGLVDMAVGFVVLAAAMVYYGQVPTWHIVFLPFFVLFAVVTSIAVTLWLSALNVRYRDVHHAIPFLILLGLFISPITYPFNLVPASVQPIYAINPLVGVLETYRWMLFPTAGWPGAIVLIPIAASIILLVTGAAYFHRAESRFADII